MQDDNLLPTQESPPCFNELSEMEREIIEAEEKEKAEYGAPYEIVEKYLPFEIVLKSVEEVEDGDAYLFIKLCKDKLCYDHSLGEFYVWQGHYWEIDKVNSALAMTGDVIAVYDHYFQECSNKSSDALLAERLEESKRYAKYAEKFRSQINKLHCLNRKEHVLKLARAGNDSLGVSGENWDKIPMLLGCKNGTIELNTGIFRIGRQEDYIRTVCPTEFKGLDEIPALWEKMLDEIFEGNIDLINYIQKLFGYGITGLTTEHFFTIFYGGGRNGKGNILETIKFVLGELAAPVRAEMLLDQKYSSSSASPSPDLMSLRGRRIVWASETNEGHKLNAGKVKFLTGGDSITARAPYSRREVTFKPTHKLIMLTNNKPNVPGDDGALWHRLHLVPFSLSFVRTPVKPNERLIDFDLPENLKKEASAILAWLVKGCLKYLDEGLELPSTIQDATNEYRTEEDELSQFVDEWCEVGTNFQESANKLYNSFREFCQENGYPGSNATNFGRKMAKLYKKGKDSKGYVVYLGLKLKQDYDDSEEMDFKENYAKIKQQEALKNDDEWTF